MILSPFREPIDTHGEGHWCGWTLEPTRWKQAEHLGNFSGWKLEESFSDSACFKGWNWPPCCNPVSKCPYCVHVQVYLPAIRCKTTVIVFWAWSLSKEQVTNQLICTPRSGVVLFRGSVYTLAVCTLKLLLLCQHAATLLLAYCSYELPSAAFAWPISILLSVAVLVQLVCIFCEEVEESIIIIVSGTCIVCMSRIHVLLYLSTGSQPAGTGVNSCFFVYSLTFLYFHWQGYTTWDAGLQRSNTR